MKIGIIGAGNIGQAIVKLAIAQGHDVMLSNSRGPETLVDLTSQIGGSAGTAREAAAFGEVVVVTIPFKNVFTLSSELLEGRVVLDTNNYYPDRDGHFADLDGFRTTTSGKVAAHFRGAKVVKAFNAILAADLALPLMPVGHSRRALPIAGDDAGAKAIVVQLHDEFGFDVVDAGSLAESWRFERAKPAYCVPFDVAGLKAALAQAQRTVELPHGSWRRR